MIKTLIKPSYNPKYKIKSTTEKLNPNSSTLPSNLQNFKQKLISGSGFTEYK